MRNSIAKLIHKYAITQDGYDIVERSISHSRKLTTKELVRLKNPKDIDKRITSKQKVIKGNIIGRNLKKLWNNTPTPEKPELKATMSSAI